MRILSNVPPTPEQLGILNDYGTGFRLIRGAAGSGKTTTALLRLRQLCGSRLSRHTNLGLSGPVRVLVLTFNSTLKGYISQLANEQVQDSQDLDLTIDTFARWALDLVGEQNILQDDGHGYLIGRLQEIGVPAANLNYFVDEVKYVQGRFHSDQRADYLDELRAGRGRAPAVPRQMRGRILNEVIVPYENEKRRLGRIDWNDLAVAAASADKQGYDVVVVDEAQDLSANQIRAIVAHLSDDHATTFIIDALQRVYPQGFRWQEVGINMRPELVLSLRKNYRNTAEVARLASSLVQDLPQEEDGSLPDENSCEESGRIPTIVMGRFSAQIDFMLNQVQSYLDMGETVAILHPKGYGWFNYIRQKLRERSIFFCELTRSREWPTGPELVALSTIHSAKGLEFDHVLMPGLNMEVTPHGDEDGDGTLESLRRLIAMGIGRARNTVMLGYKEEDRSSIFDYIDPSTYEEIQV